MPPAAAPASPPSGREEAVTAPFLWGRRLLRSLLTHGQASELGDRFVRAVPGAIQRACERQFDFPVSRPVRASPLLLIRIPKTASVSLSLQVYGRVSHIPHRTAAFYKAADPRFYASVTAFAVVRNPWERARSAFEWLKGRGNALAAPDRHARRAMSRVASFEAFVLDVLLPAAEDGRLARLDPVFHSQSGYVCDRDGALLVDRVFRLERMDEVQAFLRHNGVDRGEERANASPAGAAPAAGAARTAEAAGTMAPDVARAIGTVYARDVALFGYGPAGPRDGSGARGRVHPDGRAG